MKRTSRKTHQKRNDDEDTKCRSAINKQPRMMNCDKDAECLAGTSQHEHDERVEIVLDTAEFDEVVGSDACIDELLQDEPIKVVINSANYEKVVESAAFVDKTLHIKNFFEEFRKQNTHMRTVLISAPNRFGKSTNMNMLKRFLELRTDVKGDPIINVEKDMVGKWVETEERSENFKLFASRKLKIYQCQCLSKHTEDECKGGKCESRSFFYEHCGKHPIIYLTLKDVVCDSDDHLISSLQTVVHEAYEGHPYLGKEEASRLSEDQRKAFLFWYEVQLAQGKKDISLPELIEGLKNLVKYLEKQFEKKVYVLIEEFDAPISRLLFSEQNLDIKYVDHVMMTVGTMLSSVLKDNEQVAGALINACVQVEHALSPYANNVEHYPFLEDHRFSDYCGFTDAEVKEMLQQPNFLGFSADKILKNYNGYQVFKSEAKLCCGFSVLKYFDAWEQKRMRHREQKMPSPEKEKHVPKNYWVESHGVSGLEELFSVYEIRKRIEEVWNKGSIFIRTESEKMSAKQMFRLRNVLNLGSAKEEDVDLFLLFLKDRGYFSVKGKSDTGIMLEIPSVEISREFGKKFYSTRFYKKQKFAAENIHRYVKSLISLDGDKKYTFQNLAESVKTLFSVPMSRPASHDEVKGPLYTYALNDRSNRETHTEIICEEGRSFRLDLLIVRKDGTGIIFEVKYGPASEMQGLRQIFDCHYTKAFEGHKLTKQKIYVGLHYHADGQVSVAALATDARKVIETWDEVDVNKVIYVSTKQNCRSKSNTDLK